MKKELIHLLKENKIMIKRITTEIFINGYYLKTTDKFNGFHDMDSCLDIWGEENNTILNINWKSIKSFDNCSEFILIRLTKDTKIYLRFLE